MSNLFVQDDDDDNHHGSSLPDRQQSQRPTPAGDTIHEVNEDDIVSDDLEDDPIVTEIPIILKDTPSADQEIYALQYPSRPKHRQLTDANRVLESRLKPESGFIEVDVPVDTTRFYDEMKADGWGGVSKQTLQGVLLDLEGYFVGNVQNGELILLPLNGITQLRSSLKHIDREFNDKKEMTRLENNANRTNGHDIQVVQMTVRSTTDNAPRLGGALLARKKVDEETYQVLTWNDLNDESTKKIREELLESNENLKVELTPLTTNEEHIDLLVKETLV